ncbi:MAG: hypothetical protein IKR97_02115 [Eubacterium sp.]|nr:hypothetical protein [Eubacterium sp.]
MKTSKQIAFASIFTALILVIMFLGSALSVLTYVAPLICSIIMMILNDIAGKKFAFLSYAAVSIISIIFLTDKECALTFAFFFGYYAIIRDNIEKIKPKWLCFLIKFLIFNLGIIASQLLLVYAFGIPLDLPWGKWGILVFIILINLVFLMYEFMLKRVIILYKIKYKSKIDKLLK